MHTVMESAEFLAKHGWPVVAVPPSPMAPTDLAALTAHASDDPGAVKAMFDETPGALIGVPLGTRSRTFIVRVEGLAGLASLSRVEDEERRPLPMSLRSVPEEGVTDVWLELPWGYSVETLRDYRPGLHVLCEGELGIAPPLSKWLAGPLDCSLDWPPPWVMRRLGKRVELPGPPDDAPPLHKAALRLAQEVSFAAMAEGGQRYDRILEAARKLAPLRAAGIGAAEIFNQLLRAADHNDITRHPALWAALEPQLCAVLGLHTGERRFGRF